MVAIAFAPRREDALSDVEPIISGGWALFRPSVTIEGAQWVFDEWSQKVMLDGTAKTLLLDPNDTVPYEMLMDIPDGMGGRKKVTEFRFVKTNTASGATWQSLQKVTGPTGESLPTGTQAAINADLYAQINNVSGGATNLAGITNMSPVARTFNTQTTTALLRSNIGAADDANTVHRTGTESIGGAKAFTDGVTFNVPTTGVTPTTANHFATKAYADSVGGGGGGTPAWTAITGKPSTFPPTVPIAQSDITGLVAALAATPWLLFPFGGVFPARPATTRSVWFMSSTITPASDGSTGGGGGMVVGLDVHVKALA